MKAKNGLSSAKIWKDFRLAWSFNGAAVLEGLARACPDLTFSRAYRHNFKHIMSRAISAKATQMCRDSLAKRQIGREDEAAIARIAKETVSNVNFRLRSDGTPENFKKLIRDGMKVPAKNFVEFVRQALDAAESHAPMFDRIDSAILLLFLPGLAFRGRSILPLAHLSDPGAAKFTENLLQCRQISPDMYKKRRQRLGLPSLSKRLRKFCKNKTYYSISVKLPPL